MKKYGVRGTRDELLTRPGLRSDVEPVVREILARVKREGDKAVKDFEKKYAVKGEVRRAGMQVNTGLKKAIRVAARNIEKFHRAQLRNETVVKIMPGVKAWRGSVPLERVGLYIPGGSAPLFSTVLMLGIPARIAGCREVILCTPPDKNGDIHPAILYAAKVVGIKKIFKCGGAQAIAAMAYGTKRIPKVDKIFGPGNAYVTLAKQLVAAEGIAIDMPAGPSEVAILADRTCKPEFVAADLLSQAEHGPDSQVILVSDSDAVIENVMKELRQQLSALPRKNIAEKALQHSKAFRVKNMKAGLELLNEYAPEHLILACRNASSLARKVSNAGSVFIGNYSCESLGDYASGPNHTLPTGGFARAWSGVSVDTFMKKITFQEVSKKGLRSLGKAVIALAEAEGLQAHSNSVKVRMK